MVIQRIKNEFRQLLECPKCHQHFQKTPLMMECGHSFCIDCIKNLVLCSLCHKFDSKRPEDRIKNSIIEDLLTMHNNILNFVEQNKSKNDEKINCDYFQDSNFENYQLNLLRYESNYDLTSSNLNKQTDCSIKKTTSQSSFSNNLSSNEDLSKGSLTKTNFLSNYNECNKADMFNDEINSNSICVVELEKNKYGFGFTLKYDQNTKQFHVLKVFLSGPANGKLQENDIVIALNQMNLCIMTLDTINNILDNIQSCILLIKKMYGKQSTEIMTINEIENKKNEKEEQEIFKAKCFNVRGRSLNGLPKNFGKREFFFD